MLGTDGAVLRIADTTSSEPHRHRSNVARLWLLDFPKVDEDEISDRGRDYVEREDTYSATIEMDFVEFFFSWEKGILSDGGISV